MIAIIVILIALVIAVILFLASLKPDSFRIERSVVIQAAPETIFLQINDLHRWAAWSTWERVDPGMKRTFNSVAVGTGASYEWQGNRRVGHGQMTIIESIVPSRLVIQLDFFAPMRARNTAEFSLSARPHGTLVTWAMYGPSPFLSKVFHVFLSMDKMVGKDFEDSLANLKAVVER